MNKTKLDNNSTKRHLRADGLSLLPSALRPRLVGVFGVLVFSIIGSLLMQNSYVSEASAVSLTLTVPSAPLSVNLNPNTDNGFAKSADSNISVSTAANWGFQLSVQAKDSNALKNGSNSLTSITTSIDEATFKSGADYVNKWGFKPSKLNSAANINFVAGPTTSPTIIEKTSASSTSASQYTIAIGAKANSTLATGTYSNNFTFTATANTVSYNITYNLDSGIWSGKSPQTGSTIEKTIKLDENKPTKDGFEFLGWCTVEPTGNNTDNPTCDNSNNGTIYTAGQDYPLTNGSNTVTLNAIWKSTKPPLLTSIVTVDPDVNEITFKVGSGIEMIMVGDPTKNDTNYWRPSYGFSGTDIVMPVTGGEKILVSVTPKANYKLGSWTKTTGSTQTWTANGVEGTYDKMKDVTHATCIAAGEEGMNVTDERNGISYTIGKFADRCWMFSNLRLEPGTTLTSATSAVSSDFILPTQADSDAWTSESQNYYSKKNMKVCKGATGYTTSGNGGGKCADQTTGVTEYYYNWYAAMANDSSALNPTSSSSSGTSQDAQSKGSICPKNWRLIPRENTSDTDDIKNAWNADKTGNPGRLVSSGRFISGSQYNVGNDGGWWSSRRDNNGNARYFSLLNGAANGSFSTKVIGYSVRCELKPKEITDLQYLQDWNDLTDDEKTQVKSSMQEEKNYTLTDKRDNTEYTVAKLKDGKIWMTQNLRIGGEQPKDISSSDSDMASGSFTIPSSNLSIFDVGRGSSGYNQVNNSAAYVDSTYGGYYTWYTATAGTGNSSITWGGDNATSSICPKGWKLPASGSSSEFNDLVTAYGGENSTGSAALRATPVPGFTYAGYVLYDYGSLNYQGSDGAYWSSTSGGSTYAYSLYLFSSYAAPTYFDYRVNGYSVRCVAR